MTGGMVWLLLSFLLVHGFLCLCMYFLLRMKILKSDPMLLPVCIFVPFFGMLLTVLLSFADRWGKTGRKNADLESMRKNLLGAGSTPETEEESGNAIPLEDALILNDNQTRRSVMMDVLLHESSDYSNVLRMAKENADAEVVHYATTALSELNKEYDIRLQKLSKEYEEHPGDDSVLDLYLDTLDDYLRNELADGELLRIQRTRYTTLLKKRIALKGMPEDHQALVRSLMYSGEYEQAEHWLCRMEELWPEREETMRLRLRYYYELGMGRQFQSYLDAISGNGRYLSSSLRSDLRFWRVHLAKSWAAQTAGERKV